MNVVLTSEEIRYQVKTPVFEGPFDVLLRLIEERKLFINEISLAQVTDDYIHYIKSLEAEGDASMSEITSFITIAATLILIKSKSLLPNIDLTTEETTQISDLEERLRLYQIFKNASVLIKNDFGKRIIFNRGDTNQNDPIFTPDPMISIAEMLSSVREVVQNLPKKEFLPEVSIRKVISIEEMIGSLIDRVEKNMRFSFSEFSKSGNPREQKEQKVFVIVGFLAMLELVREGTIAVMQENNFQDIQIEKTI